jgi:hypothetical protein
MLRLWRLTVGTGRVAAVDRGTARRSWSGCQSGPDGGRRAAGGDKGFDTRDFGGRCREIPE